MWRYLTQALDRFALRSACSSVLPSPDGAHHGAEALEFLSQEGFFCPEVPIPQVTFPSADSFRFASPIKSPWPENDIVRGRIGRTKGEWQNRPAVVIVHGWNAELQYRWMVPFWSELLVNRGINAISFELPFHGARRPTSPAAIRNFISGNLLHFLQSTHQALADLRAIVAWLRQQGVPTAGVWGTSLGAWLAGLAICHQPDIFAAALVTPVCRLDRALRDMPFGDFMRVPRDDFEGAFPLLNLASHRPVCPSENVLLVSSQHDLFAPSETIDELAEAWRAEVWRHRHGHISILMSAYIVRRITKWFVTRNEAALVRV